MKIQLLSLWWYSVPWIGQQQSLFFLFSIFCHLSSFLLSVSCTNVPRSHPFKPSSNNHSQIKNITYPEWQFCEISFSLTEQFLLHGFSQNYSHSQRSLIHHISTETISLVCYGCVLTLFTIHEDSTQLHNVFCMPKICRVFNIRNDFFSLHDYL